MSAQLLKILIFPHCIKKNLFIRVSLVAQMVKNLPSLQETQIQSLGKKDPLEKGKATQSSILAWRIPWTQEPGGLWSRGLKELYMTEWLLTLSLFTLFIIYWISICIFLSSGFSIAFHWSVCAPTSLFSFLIKRLYDILYWSVRIRSLTNYFSF